MVVAHSQFLTKIGEDGFPNMMMLDKTPIYVYELHSGKLTKVFAVSELATQALSYAPEWQSILAFSSGQHKIFKLGDREGSNLLTFEMSTRFENISDACLIDQMQVYSTAQNIRWEVDPNWVHTFYVFLRLDHAEG